MTVPFLIRESSGEIEEVGVKEESKPIKKQQQSNPSINKVNSIASISIESLPTSDDEGSIEAEAAIFPAEFFENEQVSLVETSKIQKQPTQKVIYSSAQHLMRSPNEFEKIHWSLKFRVYFSWLAAFFIGMLKDLIENFITSSTSKFTDDPRCKNFAPLFTGFDPIFIRRLYMPSRDVVELPIASCPGDSVNIVDRYSQDGNYTYKYPGTQTNVINMASYNYLGFAQTEGVCAEKAAKNIETYGIAVCSTSQERGSTIYQRELEQFVAGFLGTEDAICFSMGFATNSLNIGCLADEGTLIISDQKNHASLILGMRMSGASAKVFPHNDLSALEELLLEAVKNGNPKTNRPYSKILIIVEGIYSMEGSICPLPEIIALKKKYKAYLYMDEAHSIGAMGETGRGIVEYWNCDVGDVDIMMGTFTKSFGAAGGYIAGTKELIDHLRVHSASGFYSAPLSPPIAEQIYSSMEIISGTNQGANKISRLAENSRYFRRLLKKEGFIIYGSDDSPVIPMLICFPHFIGRFGREMLKRRVATVVVSHPACEMAESRIRFCVSAAHSKEQLDIVVERLKEVNEMANVRFSQKRLN